ncbi:hypothetical protein D8M09_17345 [Enterobacter sp. R1(2018)]|nr:hypothetical protein D8M09_17345 [Enterobacter sp. R1(2018)]
MLIAKIVGIAWMLTWFFILVKAMSRNVSNGLDPFAAIAATTTVWFIIGMCPVLIVKFGWTYIK